MLNRRSFFGAAIAAVGATLLRASEPVAAMVPIMKPTNKKAYVFVRENEAAWLDQATKLANQTMRQHVQVTISDCDGVPYVAETMTEADFGEAIR